MGPKQILAMLASMGEDGTIIFNNSKVAVIVFTKKYNKVPFISLTPNDMITFPAFKQTASTTGVTIKLTANWTGSMDYKITARL